MGVIPLSHRSAKRKEVMSCENLNIFFATRYASIGGIRRLTLKHRTRRNIISTRSWTIVLACSIVINLTSGRADAGQIQSKGSFSGSIINAESDTNGDGQKAILYMLGFKTSLGPATAQAMIEFAFGDPATCPNGNPGVEFTPVSGGAAHIIRRYNSTGDLLFLHITSATGCFDLTTQLQFASGVGGNYWRNWTVCRGNGNH